MLKINHPIICETSYGEQPEVIARTNSWSLDEG
jgi:hypothetical protein